MSIPQYRPGQASSPRWLVGLTWIAWLATAVACLGWVFWELVPTLARPTELTELQITWARIQSFLIWVCPGILIALGLHTLAGVTSFLADAEGPPLSAVHHAKALMSGRRRERTPHTLPSSDAKAQAVREVIAWQHASDQDE